MDEKERGIKEGDEIHLFLFFLQFAETVKRRKGGEKRQSKKTNL